MKIRSLVRATAAVLSCFGSAAIAETTAVLSYESLVVDGEGGSEADISGVVLDVEGRYPGGFRFDSSLSYREVDDISIEGTDVGMGWHYSNLTGPAIRYMRGGTLGISEDTFMAGISGAYEDERFFIGGELVSDVDAFGDTFLVRAGLDYGMTDYYSLTADIDHIVTEGTEDSTLLNIGVEYAITGGSYIRGGVTGGKLQGNRARGVNLGIALDF